MSPSKEVPRDGSAGHVLGGEGVRAEELEEQRVLEWGTQGVAEGHDPEVGEIGQQAEYENLPPAFVAECRGALKPGKTRAWNWRLELGLLPCVSLIH